MMRCFLMTCTSCVRSPGGDAFQKGYPMVKGRILLKMPGTKKMVRIINRYEKLDQYKEVLFSNNNLHGGGHSTIHGGVFPVGPIVFLFIGEISLYKDKAFILH